MSLSALPKAPQVDNTMTPGLFSETIHDLGWTAVNAGCIFTNRCCCWVQIHDINTTDLTSELTPDAFGEMALVRKLKRLN